jgi:hypothetical protein
MEWMLLYVEISLRTGRNGKKGSRSLTANLTGRHFKPVICANKRRFSSLPIPV